MKRNRLNPQTILITGASSGLGKALALDYATNGIVLHLGARRDSELRDCADACRAKGATVFTRVIDVTDREDMRGWISGIESQSSLDLVIANAGISAGTSGMLTDMETESQLSTLFKTNVDGVFNTVMPALEFMRGRGCGQIALVSSIAGFRGMPGAPAYCATKAAVRVWGEGMRALLASEGVAINVICPGFVRTPMTDTNTFTMPFLMDPETAARRIRKKLSENRGRITFPFAMALGSWILRSIPDGLANWVAERTPRK